MRIFEILVFLFLLHSLGYPLVHTVQKGDTLWKLSKNFGVDEQTLIRLNELIRPTLFVGQKIYIPDQIKSYKVKTGDNLTRIARHFGVSVGQLILINNLPNESIFVGQILKIPMQNQNRSLKKQTVFPTKTKKIIHKVKAGETLIGISRKYSVTKQQIKQWNRLNRDSLYIGESLIIHSKILTQNKTHIVQKGETLSGISKKYNIKLNTLMKVNQLQSPRLFVNQKLKIPYFPSDSNNNSDPDKFLSEKSASIKLSSSAPKLSLPFNKKRVREIEKTERGILIHLSQKTSIRSMAQGQVEYAGFLKGYEQVIIVRHSEKLRVIYGHLMRVWVQRGDILSRGDLIGQTDSGNFYLEFREGTKTLNPFGYFSFFKSFRSVAKK